MSVEKKVEKKYKLKCKIEQQGLNSEKVAESIGIDRSTFYKRLNNGVIFSSNELLKLVEVLKLSNEEILDIFFNRKVS